MYQTTFGSHNHRSCSDDPKAGGNRAYYESYRVPESLQLIPELFSKAGYAVVNGGKGKEDYNFIARERALLRRGLAETRRRASRSSPRSNCMAARIAGRRLPIPRTPHRVTLPPYYPDDPVIRQDWASYLNSWVKADADVGDVLDRLERDGLADSTVVFFFTDHGISHVRGKQFLYDEGIRVPLLVRFPDRRLGGTVRSDLVSLIDVAATSLDLAGIPIPGLRPGPGAVRGGFRAAAPRLQRPRPLRRDPGPDPQRAHGAVQIHPQLHVLRLPRATESVQGRQGDHEADAGPCIEKGKLNELQARIFAPSRPTEELYDLKADPFETRNLAGDPDHQQIVGELRADLFEWMIANRDLGLIPEPILEEMGARYGSKYAVLRAPENADLVKTLLATIEAGARGDRDVLLKALGVDAAGRALLGRASGSAAMGRPMRSRVSGRSSRTPPPPSASPPGGPWSSSAARARPWRSLGASSATRT